MSIVVKIRRGEGPFWGALKSAARTILTFHLPAEGFLRPLFRLLYQLHVFAREGLIWSLRFFWYEPLFRSQCAKIGTRFQMEKLPYLSGQGVIIIGDNVRLSGKQSVGFSNRLLERPVLKIGDSTFVGHGTGFAVAESVEIGKNCLLAGGISIRDFDGHPIDAVQRRQSEPTPPEGVSPVIIGDDVWIGSAATILKGVIIGPRSIVASQSVVTRSVPADTVVAGNPARIVRNLVAAEATE